MANSAWGELNWGLGTFGGQNDITVLLTGEQLVKVLESNIGVSAGGSVQVPASEEVELNLNLNSVNFTIDGSVVPATNLANLTLNSVSAFETIFVPVTAPGTPTTWGSGSWGSGSWGENIGLELFGGSATVDVITPVNVTGELLTTVLNPVVSFVINTTVLLTGEQLIKVLESNIGISAGGSVQVPASEEVQLGLALGNVDPAPDASVTGQQLTLTLSSVDVDISIVGIVTGELLSTSLNSVSIDLNTPVNVTGQNLTLALNSVVTKLDVNVNVTGFGLTGRTGQLYVSAWAAVNTGQSINWTEVAA
jgi:hypothetical protein